MAIDLGLIFTARDLASPVVRQIRGELNNLFTATGTNQMQVQRLTHSMAAFGASILTLGAAAKVASVPLSFVDTAGKFEASYTKMGAVLGLTTDEIGKLRQEALDITKKGSAFSPDSLIEGMNALGTAGMNTGQIMKSIQPTLNLSGASQGMLSLDKSAEVVTAGLNAFGMRADQAGVLTDKLVKALGISTLGFKDLDGMMARGGSTAYATNQDLSMMLATVGVIKQQGGTAADATNKFRMVMQKFQGNLKPTQKGLASIGLSVTDLMSNGKFMKFPDIIDKMSGALERQASKMGNKNEQEMFRRMTLTQILGKDAMQAYNKVKQAQVEISEKDIATIRKNNSALADQIQMRRTESGEMVGVLKGTNAIRANYILIEKSQGAAQKANDAYLGSLEGMKAQFASLWQTMKITLGTPLLGAAKMVMSIVNNYIMKPLLTFFDTFPAASAAISYGLMGIAGALALVSAGFAAYGIGAALSFLMNTRGIISVMSWLGRLYAVTSIAAQGFLLFSSAPLIIGGIGVALAGVIGYLLLTGDGFEKLKAIVTGVTTGIKLAWQTLTGTLKTGETKSMLAQLGFYPSEINETLMSIKAVSATFGRLIGNVDATGKSIAQAKREMSAFDSFAPAAAAGMGGKLIAPKIDTSGVKDFTDKVVIATNKTLQMVNALLELANAIKTVINAPGDLFQAFKDNSGISAISEWWKSKGEKDALTERLIQKRLDARRTGAPMPKTPAMLLPKQTPIQSPVPPTAAPAPMASPVADIAQANASAMQMLQNVSASTQQVKSAVATIPPAVAASISPVGPTIAGGIQSGSNTASGALRGIGTAATTVPPAIAAVQNAAPWMGVAVEAAAAASSGALTGIPGAVSGVPGEITALFGSLSANLGAIAQQAGANFATTLASSIRAGAGQVQAAVAQVAAAGAKNVKGNSPPKYGPLKHLDDFGYNIPKVLAENIRVGSDLPQKEMARIASAISDSASRPSILNDGPRSPFNSPSMLPDLGPKPQAPDTTPSMEDLAMMLASMMPQQNNQARPPQIIQLQVDGRTLAQVIQDQVEDDTRRRFIA